MCNNQDCADYDNLIIVYRHALSWVQLRITVWFSKTSTVDTHMWANDYIYVTTRMYVCGCYCSWEKNVFYLNTLIYMWMHFN